MPSSTSWRRGLDETCVNTLLRCPESLLGIVATAGAARCHLHMMLTEPPRCGHLRSLRFDLLTCQHSGSPAAWRQSLRPTACVPLTEALAAPPPLCSLLCMG